MEEEEQEVIEAATEWAMWRVGVHYGPCGERLKKAERALEKAVERLHSEHDGQWKST